MTGRDVIVVMGVSGLGQDHRRQGHRDGDGLGLRRGRRVPLRANVAKMAAGHPLTDEDRWPWLRAIGCLDGRAQRAAASAVVTCSALRRVYRDLLREGRPQVRFCHVERRPGADRGPAERRAGPLHAAVPAAQPARDAGAAPAGRAGCGRPRDGYRPRGTPSHDSPPARRHGSRPVTTAVLSLCPLRSAAPARRSCSSPQLLGIATVVLLITAAKFHPFLALILGTARSASSPRCRLAAIIDSFTKGFGSTVGTRRAADRARGDGRQAARRLRRRRPDRRHDHRPGRRASGCPGRWP